jgi:hypothetical protein
MDVHNERLAYLSGYKDAALFLLVSLHRTGYRASDILKSLEECLNVDSPSSQIPYILEHLKKQFKRLATDDEIKYAARHFAQSLKQRSLEIQHTALVDTQKKTEEEVLKGLANLRMMDEKFCSSEFDA